MAGGVQAPRFTGAAALDLGGLGIRGMAWSEVAAAQRRFTDAIVHVD